MDEISALQKKIGSLEEEVQDLRTAAKQPQESLNQLERQIDNLTREANQWRQRSDYVSFLPCHFKPHARTFKPVPPRVGSCAP